MPNVVAVVGAGLAGLRTVEGLREKGFDGRIVLIGAEPHAPYDRPPLSKQVLRGERDLVWLRPNGDLTDLNVELHLGQLATGVDLDAKVLQTSAGPVGYDTLVIASGAIPRRIPGVDGLVLRSWDDAQALRAALTPGVRLAVLGAGLIGCEVAASARALGAEVTLIDLLPGPLIRVLGAEVAELVAELQRSHGVVLQMGRALVSASGGQLTLDDGTVVEADVVLEAIGATPDTAWLAGSDIKVDNGVVCDADGRAAPDVFAVGDVARWAGHRAEHWTSAVEQAEQVAAAILGLEPAVRGPAYWWSDMYDLKLQGLGSPGLEDDVQLVVWGPKARTIALYSAGGRLTGVVGFSAPAAVMRLRGDITAGTPVAEVAERLQG